MGRSSAFTPGAADIEDFSPEKLEFDGGNGRRYRVEVVGNQIVHHEIGMDGSGNAVYDRSAPITLAIGSGTRGKSYGINRNGLFFQSPISWYTRDGGFFQLSPGFGRRTKPHFERRLSDECLHCHTGVMVRHPRQPHRLVEPFFQEVAIGCERCHGPGREHVRRQESDNPPVPDDSIVNPAKLAPRKREAVCNQCHLHGEFQVARYGRKPYDFRPGMELDDVLMVFVVGAGFDKEGHTKSVSHVMQMQSSACFQRSNGKLGCISCHNPHDKERPDNRVKFYRQRCLECHADQGCSLPVEQQNAAPAEGSCIHCHMPAAVARDIVHASQTDHRVLKEPSAAAALAEDGDRGFENWKLFDGAEKRLPAWEVRRARGLAMVDAASRGQFPRSRLREAAILLAPLVEHLPEDYELCYALAQCALEEQRGDDALKYLEQAVRLHPENDLYLESLARLYVSFAKYEDALATIERCLSLNPWHARNYALQAEIMASVGDREGALRAVRKAYALDPNERGLQDRIEERLRAVRD
jgi:hypothetical protein